MTKEFNKKELELLMQDNQSYYDDLICEEQKVRNELELIKDELKKYDGILSKLSEMYNK